MEPISYRNHSSGGERLLRHFIQWKTTFALLIVFTGTSIGANNFIKYETGAADLRSRTEYCQFIEKSNSASINGADSYQTLGESETLSSEKDLITFSRIWNLKKTLAAYRAKRITFSYLPKPIVKVITEKSLSLISQKLEIERNILAIQKKMQQPGAESILQRAPSKYTQWQIRNEWPLQLKLLNELLRKLDNQLQNLSEKKLTDSELLMLIQSSETIINEKLMIEVKVESGLLSSDLAFYPVWKINQRYRKASETPWFRVKKKFLPKSSIEQMANKQVPNSLKGYLLVASKAYNSKIPFDHSGIHYTENGRILLSGSPKTGFLSDMDSMTYTSPNDLTVEGLLDLACLYSSTPSSH